MEWLMAAYIAEWTRGQDAIGQLLQINGETLRFDFVPRPRYLGARAHEIGDVATYRHMIYGGGFKEYKGPILEGIPESLTMADKIDWVGTIGIIWERYLTDDDRLEFLKSIEPDEDVKEKKTRSIKGGK